MSILKIKNTIPVIVLLMLSAEAASGQAEKKQAKTNNGSPHKKKSLYYRAPRLDIQEVINFTDSIGILNPDIVVKQALLETGHFKSRALMDKNNLFAFRHTKSYIHFETWQHSISYYKKWQQKFYTDPNEDYCLFLKRIKYASAPNYISVLKQIKLKSTPPPCVQIQKP